MDDALNFRRVGRVRRVRLRHRAMRHGSLASGFVVASYGAMRLLHAL